MKIRSLAKTVNDRGEYAEKEDFVKLFGRERSELQKLAVLLTADRESAQRSVACAFHDCVTNGSVFRRWIRIWARRMVIRNAIIEAMEHNRAPLATTNEYTDVELTGFSEADFANLGTGYDSILALPKFERFVFVISTLERYSLYDCALLLGRSLRDVHEARQWLGNQLGPLSEHTEIRQQASSINRYASQWVDD